MLVSAGRRPNVEGLNLNLVNVDWNEKDGVKVDKYLKTTNSDIYAVGDCCSKYQFTHNSDIHAWYVVRNALFEDAKDHT